MAKPLLELKHLRTAFYDGKTALMAVDDVSFSINEGEIIGLVGESGCGKSVTSLSIMRLLGGGGKTIGGSIFFDGHDLLKLQEKEMRSIRGNDIAMVFQEPMTSLNPVYKIGKQIDESVMVHEKVSKQAARLRTLEILKQVGIPRAEKIVSDYPYQLSGGMRQRVMIAMAMVCKPKLLIADEPTTALDVTIQAQILELMRKLNRENGTAILLITHDLGVVAEMCSRVIVMYCGKVVEETNAEHLFDQPKHPYSQGLIASTPKLGNHTERLGTIKGNVPSLHHLPKGCRFAPRCPHVMTICKKQIPELQAVGDADRCRCFLYQTQEAK